jgi:hypothetical protein
MRYVAKLAKSHKENGEGGWACLAQVYFIYVLGVALKLNHLELSYSLNFLNYVKEHSNSLFLIIQVTWKYIPCLQNEM